MLEHAPDQSQVSQPFSASSGERTSIPSFQLEPCADAKVDDQQGIFDDSYISEAAIEVNLLGYKNRGESVVIFVKCDQQACFAALIDSYEEHDVNRAVELLKREKLKYFNFVCWTHAHTDHSIGMLNILENYICRSKKSRTIFCFPYSVNPARVFSSSKTKEIYDGIIQYLKEPKSKSFCHKIAKIDTCLVKRMYKGAANLPNIDLTITSFAPVDDICQRIEARRTRANENVYSVGLIVKFANECLLLTGDVPNCVFNYSEVCTTLQNRFRYIKIPHHGSLGSSALLKYIRKMPNSVAVSSVYSNYRLPQKSILDSYLSKVSNLYTTMPVHKQASGDFEYGVVGIKICVDSEGNKYIGHRLEGGATPYGSSP